MINITGTNIIEISRISDKGVRKVRILSASLSVFIPARAAIYKYLEFPLVIVSVSGACGSAHITR